MSDQPQSQGDRSGSEGAPSSAGLAPPPPIKVPAATPKAAAVEANEEFPSEVEMTLVGHLEELRSRVLRSLLAVVVGAAACLLFVRPLVRLLEVPAKGIHFLQLAPGEFLLVSLKVAGYAGLTLALPYVHYEGLAFVLPGLTRTEQKLVAPAVAGSALLFLAGLAFAWWALVPAALNFLVSYGADVVEPLWSIERYLDFVLLLMVARIGLQLPSCNAAGPWGSCARGHAWSLAVCGGLSPSRGGAHPSATPSRCCCSAGLSRPLSRGSARVVQRPA